jgi:hypothetical protein
MKTGTVLRKLRGLLGLRSPSEWVPVAPGKWERWEDLGAAIAEGMARGFEQVDARRAELIASGMTPEEAQAVLLREVVLNADPAMLAYSEGVVRRSFWSLYDDEENGD